jgi:hypothetical protein
MSLPGNDLLTAVENAQDVPTLAIKLGQYLRRYLIPSVQNTASGAAVGTNGNIPSPAPPQSVNVTTAGEMIQVVVTHNSPIQKGARYIYHLATNPQFVGAQIEPKEATRAPFHFTAPTKNGAGATHNYYLAVQVQYPGSLPSEPTYFGGVSPAPFTLSGSTQLDIQPGTGSGTATNGGQTLVGLGKSQVRI